MPAQAATVQSSSLMPPGIRLKIPSRATRILAALLLSDPCVTALYVYRREGQLLAELDGATLREYAWLDRMPLGPLHGREAMSRLMRPLLQGH